MSFTTNIRSIDSFSLPTPTIHTSKQSRFHRIIQLFLSFNIDQKEADENIHQHAKLVLRAFFIYMIFVSNVLVVAVLTQSQHNFLIANTYEYHLIKARFSVKGTRLERDIQYNPYRNARDKYRNAFMINFNQIATFDDVRDLLENDEKTILNIYFRSGNL